MVTLTADARPLATRVGTAQMLAFSPEAPARIKRWAALVSRGCSVWLYAQGTILLSVRPEVMRLLITIMLGVCYLLSPVFLKAAR